MRYLFLIATIILACSFTICDKIVKKDSGWEMYVYPDCSDSTTYLKQVYHERDPYKEKNKIGEWIRRVGEYSIDENFHLHDTLLSYSNHVFGHDDTFLNQNVFYGHGVWESFQVRFDKFRWITTEKYDIDVAYYDNGTFKKINIVTYPKNEHRQIASMEWDESHDTKWQGSRKAVFNDRQDSVISEDESTGQVNTLIISHDSDVKNGWWKKYNTKNEVLDSIYYPDPKH